MENKQDKSKEKEYKYHFKTTRKLVCTISPKLPEKTILKSLPSCKVGIFIVEDDMDTGFSAEEKEKINKLCLDSIPTIAKIIKENEALIGREISNSASKDLELALSYKTQGIHSTNELKVDKDLYRMEDLLNSVYQKLELNAHLVPNRDVKYSGFELCIDTVPDKRYFHGDTKEITVKFDENGSYTGSSQRFFGRGRAGKASDELEGYRENKLLTLLYSIGAKLSKDKKTKYERVDETEDSKK